MHIAICLWGILRSLTYTLHSMHEMCLKPILHQGHTYEIFVHTYNFSGNYMSVRNNEKAVQLNFSEWKILHPDHVQIENQDIFDKTFRYNDYMSLGDPWKTNFTSFVNHMRALNSLRQLARAVEDQHNKPNSTKFDAVVYLRPDVTYLNELPIYLINEYKNTLFVPNFHRKCFGGEYNDRMAMGDYRSGIIYGKKLDAALAYSLVKPLHSEKFTFDYLKDNNVPVLEIPFRFRRVRAQGVLHDRDELVYSPKEQEYLVRTDTLPHRTSYLVRCFYNFLEYITFGQVYIWAHDDTENQLCAPNKHVTFKTMMRLRKQVMAASSKIEKSERGKMLLAQILSVQEEMKEYANAIIPFSATGEPRLVEVFGGYGADQKLHLRGSVQAHNCTETNCTVGSGHRRNEYGTEGSLVLQKDNSTFHSRIYAMIPSRTRGPLVVKESTLVDIPLVAVV